MWARRGLLLLLMLGLPAGGQPRQPGARNAPTPPIAEMIFDGGLKAGWLDYGWAPRTLGPGPAALNLSNHGGWIIAHPGLAARFGGVTLRFWAGESLGDFLELRIDDGSARMFPAVAVQAHDRRSLRDDRGGEEVWVPIDKLDPEGLPFDRIVIRARETVPSDPVLIDRIGLTSPDPKKAAPSPSLAMGAVVPLRIDCRADGKPIKPTIYGVAFDAQRDAREPPWFLNPGARRWGGSPTSRYNWNIGAWNTASDWYFRNVHVGATGSLAHETFLADDRRHRVESAFTIPTMGWVAKDDTSASFPTDSFGVQQAADPYSPGFGNGVGPTGKPLKAGAPTSTSVALSPDDVRRFVAKLHASDPASSERAVDLYLLDNEPMLWSSTHRDVHPEPVGYDELLQRSIAYGSAIRAADPHATIAGPALWGWPAYSYSAIDAKAGFRFHPDRAAHGNQPLLPWYLKKLREYRERTGTRILDVVDVHFYPQGAGIREGTGGGTDLDTNARRLRATRALWDPSYVDESWIGEAVDLIPRLRRWIAASDPGLGISIGEWSFGAENDMSGALAIAEALGRFGQLGVDYAFYWTYPAPGTPAAWAFRAYRNFDGNGGRFLDVALPTQSAGDTSLFASRDERGDHVVAVALNLDPARPADVGLDVDTCGSLAGRTFTYAGGVAGLTAGPPVRTANGALRLTLAPYSITVLDLTRSSAQATRESP